MVVVVVVVVVVGCWWGGGGGDVDSGDVYGGDVDGHGADGGADGSLYYMNNAVLSAIPDSHSGDYEAVSVRETVDFPET